MERKERKKGNKLWQRSRRRSDKDAEEGPKIVAKSSPNPSKIMLLAALGCSWGVLGRLGPVLGHLGVILGRSWGGLGASWPCAGASWGHLGAVLGRLGSRFLAKLAPGWGQDGAKMTQDGAWVAILKPIGELSWVLLVVLGAIFAKNAEV